MIWNELFKLEKGGKGSTSTSKSQAEIDAEAAQTEELAELEAQETARTDAMKRKRRGRASLMTGDETGMKDSLGA